MRSLYDFIIKPLGDRYENEIKVGDKTLVLNTKIENWKAVSVMNTNTLYNNKLKNMYNTNIKKIDKLNLRTVFHVCNF